MRLLPWLNRSASTQPWALDQRLWSWSKRDHHTLADSLAGICCLGATGSGKSSGPSAHFAQAHLRAGFGGVFTSVKPDDLATHLEWCRRADRMNDVIVFGPGHGRFFNFLDYERTRSGAGAAQTDDIVKCLLNISEIRGRDAGRGGGGGTGENAQYFQNAKEEILRACIDVLSMARQRISVPNIHRMINSAPDSIAESRDENWRKASFLWATLLQASEVEKDSQRLLDLDNAATYWLSAYPRLNDKTRTNITSSVTGTIDLLNRGVLRQHFSDGTNVTPADIAAGKILLFDMSLKQWGETGAMAQVIWKYAFAKDIERRDVRINPRPVFLHVDEFQMLFTSFDQEFASTCRSSRVAFVILSQSLPAIWSALGGGEKAKSDTYSLLGNMNLKIFCANSEVETNRYVAETLGKKRQFLVHAGHNGISTYSPMGALGRYAQSTVNASVSEHMDYQLQYGDFASLRMGGPRNKYCVDAIVYRTGQPFRASRKNWMKMRFMQNARK